VERDAVFLAGYLQTVEPCEILACPGFIGDLDRDGQLSLVLCR